MNDEKLLFDRRKMYFYDRGFKVGNAGAEFPRSWTSRFQIEKDGRAPASEAMSDKTCFNFNMCPKDFNTHTYMYIYHTLIYIYIMSVPV